MKSHAFSLLLMLATHPSKADDVPPEILVPSLADKKSVLYWSPLPQAGEEKTLSMPHSSEDGMPDLPQDGFEKVEDLRHFCQQEIGGLAGSGGKVEEIVMGDRHYWLCERAFGSKEEFKEQSLFCEKGGRLKALLVLPFQLDSIKAKRRGSVIYFYKNHGFFKTDIIISYLDLENVAH